MVVWHLPVIGVCVEFLLEIRWATLIASDCDRPGFGGLGMFLISICSFDWVLVFSLPLVFRAALWLV